MKQMMLILTAITLAGSLALGTPGKTTKVNEIKATEEKISKWQDGFLKQCQNQVESATELKRSHDYCLCVVQKHHGYLVKKINEDEKIDVEQHLKELLDLYSRAPSASGEDDSDEPSIVDLDIDLVGSCLKAAKPRSAPAKPKKK